MVEKIGFFAADTGFSLTWRKLVAILDTKFFASIYLWFFAIPILAKICAQFNNTITIYPFGSKEGLIITLELPFDWYILYFASFMFLLARLIYSMFCPVFLREFHNAGDAIAKGITVQQIIEQSSDFLRKYFSKWRRPTKVELDNIYRIFEQYRMNGLSIGALMLMGSDITGDQIADEMDQVCVTESSAKPDYYEIQGNTEGSNQVVSIQRNQFIKIVYRDLERFLDITYMHIRMTCTILVLLGILSIAWVSIKSLTFVATTIFT